MDLEPDKLTWAVLLGRWMDFARGALALPQDAQGTRLRQSVADIITLQAVWFALQHLEELPADQRALGLDRAGILIDRHAAALAQRWQGQSLPEQLRELVDDARAALAAAQLDADR